MKKALLLMALFLGTSVMVSAQTEPMKTAPAKEVKASKHTKHHHRHHKSEMKQTKTEMSNEKK